MDGALSVSLFSLHRKIGGAHYAISFPQPVTYHIRNKKILVLDTQEGLYLHNAMSGYFSDWKLSRSVFENLADYDNIDKIESSFKVNSPEGIVDEHNLMPGVMGYIPMLKKQYRRTGNLYMLN